MSRSAKFGDIRYGARSTARPVADIAAGILEPVISRRAGMTLDLVSAWPDIVGEPWGEFTMPEKINWPRRASDDDPFEPATLVVACDGARAILFQHVLGECIERVNVFFGFAAISRIRIVQKPLNRRKLPVHRELPQLGASDNARLQSILGDVENEKLRESLEKLGRGVLGSRKERK
ncbi:MAG: DciA family protein [Nitratireductor sp.]